MSDAIPEKFMTAARGLARAVEDCLTSRNTVSVLGEDRIARALMAAAKEADEAATRRERERCGWKPIETAPKDGRKVQVLAVLNPPEKWHDSVRDLPPYEGECSYHEDAGWCVCTMREVTHWRPLPQQYGWLAELKGANPRWAFLNPMDYDEHWTTDASKALRFARREDAQAFIDHSGWTAVFPTEHVWDDGKSAILKGDA